jgi:NhaA family Na+:H+ antiporter
MNSSRETRAATSRLHAFIHHEATAGLLLVATAALAIVASNTEGLRQAYDSLLNLKLSVTLGEIGLSKPLLLWINDGLMAIFFFLVGLELKREVLEGNLSSREQIVLPAAAAVGGMGVPALIYAWIVRDTPELSVGWAIPASTDIAFALGTLSLLGNRVPITLKVFLLTLATLDDLGAIMVIALFYTANLSALSLAAACVGVLVLLAFNRAHASRTALYVFVGLFIWVCVLKSGIHATLAGVVVALLIPLKRKSGAEFIHELEDGLHPYVKFFILPVFAFANAGVSMAGLSFADLTATLPLAIAAGLVLGNPIGIMLAVTLAVATGAARLPENTGWLHILGVSWLAGIGFTMSLFIGSLAFDGAALLNQVRLGVICGSLISAFAGTVVLLAASRQR